jgi:hypothetical protein
MMGTKLLKSQALRTNVPLGLNDSYNAKSKSSALAFVRLRYGLGVNEIFYS